MNGGILQRRPILSEPVVASSTVFAAGLPEPNSKFQNEDMTTLTGEGETGLSAETLEESEQTMGWEDAYQLRHRRSGRCYVGCGRNNRSTHSLSSASPAAAPADR
jgi:hypothetical protein